ncbi:MAG: hypothetical protein NTZ26_15320, partial [Candidatus Aminicenantes bacterium]|nr:hypothetical protein [Candidatus Aminicenantes bacterium]
MSAKRLLLLLAVLAAAGADVLFYRGSRLVSLAREASAPSARIEILEREPALIRDNDVAFRDLGRAWFEAAIEDLTVTGPRDDGLRRAHSAQLRSLRANPLSAATHFDLAKTLEYMRLFDLPAEEKAMEEYVKAVRLAGRDSDILALTGPALLSNWATLDPADRIVARDILKSVLSAKTEERLDAVLDLWALRIQDPGFLRAVLPAEPAAYRRVARFLAERALDRGERIHYLTAAETLEFACAGEAAASARSDFLALKIKEAEAHDRAGLELLNGIRFYQALDPTAEPIPPASVLELKRTLLLSLVRCRMEIARTLDEILPDLRAYLAVANSTSAVSDLEKALRERRLIEAKPDTSGRDLGRLALELEICFRQNRYREVTEFGQAMEGGLMMVTESARADYARVLEIVGDAYQKLDFLYESNRFYQKAKDLSAQTNLDLLAKMGKNFERLNDAPAVAALRAEAAKSLPSRAVDLAGVTVPKGTAFKQALFLESRNSRLTLKALPAGPTPAYVTLVLNGRVMWEDFLSAAPVSLLLTPEAGANELEITPWNGPLLLSGIEVEI